MANWLTKEFTKYMAECDDYAIEKYGKDASMLGIHPETLAFALLEQVKPADVIERELKL